MTDQGASIQPFKTMRRIILREYHARKGDLEQTHQQANQSTKYTTPYH